MLPPDAPSGEADVRRTRVVTRKVPRARARSCSGVRHGRPTSMSVVLPQVREGEASSRSSEAPDLPAGPEIRGVQVQGYRPTNAEGMRVSSDATVAVWIQLPFAVAVAGGGASSTSVLDWLRRCAALPGSNGLSPLANAHRRSRNDRRQFRIHFVHAWPMSCVCCPWR